MQRLGRSLTARQRAGFTMGPSVGLGPGLADLSSPSAMLIGKAHMNNLVGQWVTESQHGSAPRLAAADCLQHSQSVPGSLPAAQTRRGKV
eukprot:366049-Chlamydomonas_euryale.AAC.4